MTSDHSTSLFLGIGIAIDLVSNNSFTSEFILDDMCSSQSLTTSMGDSSLSINPKVHNQVTFLKANPLMFIKKPYEKIRGKSSMLVPSIEKPHILKVKLLLFHLKYAYMEEESTLIVIISSSFTTKEKKK